VTTYQTGPLVVWPDVEALIRAWLVANVASAPNVRTETDSTFGTTSPSPSMTLPLVLVQRIPGGSTDDNASTETAAVDVECFAKDRAGMWNLYHEVHAWMLRLSGQSTAKGAVDEVTVANGVGEVNYANPNVRRCVTTYHVSTRPAHTLP
jgi:hypothetical protein